MRALFFCLSLIVLSLVSARATPETIDSRANYVLSLIDAAKAVDGKGYSRIAYPMFQDARDEWMQLHVWSPHWKPETFERTLDVLDKALAETGKKIHGQPTPPKRDETLRLFEGIAMERSLEPDQLRYRLKNLEELQHKFSRWEPDLVSDYLGQTKAELEEATKGS